MTSSGEMTVGTVTDGRADARRSAGLDSTRPVSAAHVKKARHAAPRRASVVRDSPSADIAASQPRRSASVVAVRASSMPITSPETAAT